MQPSNVTRAATNAALRPSASSNAGVEGASNALNLRSVAPVSVSASRTTRNAALAALTGVHGLRIGGRYTTPPPHVQTQQSPSNSAIYPQQSPNNSAIHLQQSPSNPAIHPQFRSKTVCSISCRNCTSSLCQRGMRGEDVLTKRFCLATCRLSCTARTSHQQELSLCSATT